MLLSPLVGFIFAALAKPDAGKIAEASLATGATRKCPFCAELVKREAVVCRFCGRDLPPALAPAAEAEGLKCERCGGVSVPTAKKCAWCGARLASPASAHGAEH